MDQDLDDDDWLGERPTVVVTDRPPTAADIKAAHGSARRPRRKVPQGDLSGHGAASNRGEIIPKSAHNRALDNPTANEMTAAQRVADMSNWRRRLQATKVKFDDEKKGIYLSVLAETGRMGSAQRAAGVSSVTVTDHLRNDPDFKEAFDEAQMVYRDRVVERHQELLFKTPDRLHLGGKDRDEEHFEKQIPDKLLAMELKRVDTSYRETSGGVNVNVNAQGEKLGIAVTNVNLTQEEWLALFDEQQKVKQNSKPPPLLNAPRTPEQGKF